MAIFWDGLVLLILTLFVVKGVLKGALRSALSLLGVILTAYFSSILGKDLAAWLYDTFFKQSIINSVSDSINSSIGQNTADVIAQIVDNLPFISLLNPDLSNSATVVSAIESGSLTAANTVESVLSPIIIGFISILTTIFLFILISFAVRFLIRLILKVGKLPVLSQFNRILGGVLGLFSGTVIIMLLILILKLIAAFGSANQLLSDEVINSTYLFKLFYNFNIFNFDFRLT